MQSPDNDGSLPDQAINVLLIVLSMLVVFHRKVAVMELIRSNKYIFFFVLFCGISIAWSDFPFVSGKRYIKAVGNLFVISVIFSEPDYRGAINTVLKRLACVVVPMSICLIKYYPGIGRGFEEWTGAPMNYGVAGDKNALGKLCLVLGLVLASNILVSLGSKPNEEEDEKKRSRPKPMRVVDFSVFVATMWLLYKANSATSTICFFIGLGVLLLPRHSFAKRNPQNMLSSTFMLILFVVIGDFLFDLKGTIVEFLGRDMTLTGRTEVWHEVLKMTTNPWIGTGYESFWHGARYERLYGIFFWGPNQAHNGYIEVYLNLGIIGLVFLGMLIISSFLNISKNITQDYNAGVLGLAFLITLLIHNMTEAGFKGAQFFWNVFLLYSIVYRQSGKYNGRYFDNPASIG